MRRGLSLPASWWRAAVALASTAIVVQVLVPNPVAPFVFGAALMALVFRAGARSGLVALSLRSALLVPGAAALNAGLLLFEVGGPQWARLGTVLAATGGQLVLLAVSIRQSSVSSHPGRISFVIAGHGAVLAGSSVVATSPEPFQPVVGVAYVSGLTILTLHAYWAQRHQRARGDHLVGWEPVVLLFAIASMVGIGLIATVVDPSSVEPSRAQAAFLESAFLLMVGVLAAPPPPPRALTAHAGGLLEFTLQSAALTLILNVLVLTIAVSIPTLARVLFYAFAAWLAIAVAFEYAAAFHAMRTHRRFHVETPRVEAPRASVIVSSMNEERLIARTVAAAASLPGVNEVVVVVSRRSTDGTLARAREAAAAAGPLVRVVVGEGASKADDLNHVWPTLANELVLLLDADETVDASTLPWAAAALADPEVAIVQGRKAAYDPPGSFADRLVCVERRFSTLLDQTFQADAFDAAHFAGSAAIVRRSAVTELGGFSSVSLTEDIEFTMRLYRNARHRIVYEPRFLTREEIPHGLRGLVRQRARWARGWSQVYELHFLDLLRDAFRVGPRRTTGLTWQLLTSVSAPWSVFLPVLLVLSLMGQAPALPGWATFVLLFVILPSRIVSYGYAFFHDPHDATRARLRDIVPVTLLAYSWMFLGWFLQMQALYLQMASAPVTWRNTRGAGQHGSGSRDGARS